MHSRGWELAFLTTIASTLLVLVARDAGHGGGPSSAPVDTKIARIQVFIPLDCGECRPALQRFLDATRDDPALTIQFRALPSNAQDQARQHVLECAGLEDKQRDALQLLLDATATPFEADHLITQLEVANAPDMRSCVSERRFEIRILQAETLTAELGASSAAFIWAGDSALITSLRSRLGPDDRTFTWIEQ